MWISAGTKFDTFEMDEIYWFLNHKERTETRENIYIMTMMSRIPRQIVGFSVDNSIKSNILQNIVDSVPPASEYCTDGCAVYMDVIYGGKHTRNTENKNDTHEIESTNSDARHYLPGLARRNRCFYRKKETLIAVLTIFYDAYNKYGEAKLEHQVPVEHKSFNKHLHKYRDLPFSILDFL